MSWQRLEHSWILDSLSTHSLSQCSGKMRCWLFLGGRCSPCLGNSRSGKFFFVVYLCSYGYICLLFKQDWGVSATPQHTKQPQLLRAPRTNISVMFADCWLSQTEGRPAPRELARTDSLLVKISTAIMNSVHPHGVSMDFWWHSQLIALCPVPHITVAQNTCHDLTFVFFPRELSEMDCFLVVTQYFLAGNQK